MRNERWRDGAGLYLHTSSTNRGPRGLLLLNPAGWLAACCYSSCPWVARERESKMASAAAGMAASTLGLSNLASRSSISPFRVGDSMTFRPMGCLPRARRMAGKVYAVATTTVTEETKECVLPSWAEFDIGKAPVYWKTMNGLPPTAGGKLTLFYNPEASKLTLNPEFGVAFNGGFNQPFMCGGEPRSMTRKDRGKADPPLYTIKICVPKHAVSLIFSFTNGVDWDGPYKLQFEVPKAWRNKPISFFNEGLAEELYEDGACDRAIFPGSNIVATRCSMIGNLTIEGGDRCNLDIVVGCTDPSSHLYNPLADVDDGSCPLDPDEVQV